MFKVEQYNNRYKLSIGTGRIFPASNLQEVVYALQHYFQESIVMYPFEYHKHKEHARECNCCPLCRDK